MALALAIAGSDWITGKTGESGVRLGDDHFLRHIMLSERIPRHWKAPGSGVGALFCLAIPFIKGKTTLANLQRNLSIMSYLSHACEVSFFATNRKYVRRSQNRSWM